MTDFHHLNSTPALTAALEHRSIRRFLDKPIEADKMAAIFAAARAASSSSFMQVVHIMRISDPKLRHALRTIASDQAYVEHCAEFLVFCIDYAKHRTLVPEIQMDWVEALLLGATDVGIAAQNALLVAESLGLGGVFIGSLRNDIAKVAELLALPTDTIPLVGLSLGYPDQNPSQRPRLPENLTIHTNQYQAASAADFDAYNQTLRNYYQQRSGLDRDFTAQIRRGLTKPLRPWILPFLQQQGFNKR